MTILKILLMLLFFLIIHSSYAAKIDTEISSSIIVDKIETNSVKDLKKMQILLLAVKRRIIFSKDEQSKIRRFLYGLFLKKNISHKDKELAINLCVAMRIYPSLKEPLLKDGLLFLCNSPEVVKSFFTELSPKGNWFDHNVYNLLTEFVVKKREISPLNRFIILGVLHSPPMIDNREFKNFTEKVDFYITKGDLIYYKVISKNDKMLILANQYPEYSEWSNFCFSAVCEELITNESWRELVEKRVNLFMQCNDKKALNAYLDFIINNFEYEIAFMKPSLKQDFKAILKKYPDLSHKIQKVHCLFDWSVWLKSNHNPDTELALDALKLLSSDKVSEKVRTGAFLYLMCPVNEAMVRPEIINGIKQLLQITVSKSNFNIIKDTMQEYFKKFPKNNQLSLFKKIIKVNSLQDNIVSEEKTLTTETKNVSP